MASQLPPGTQSSLVLPVPIRNGALQKLATTRNPLLEHYESCYERLTSLAEYQAIFHTSERVSELEEALRDLIDTHRDLSAIKESLMLVSQQHAQGQIHPQDTARGIFERTEVAKTNYRALDPSAKYRDAKALDEFKRRVFDIEHPQDDYPGLLHFLRPPRRGPNGNSSNHGGGQNHGEGEEDDEEELEMTYRTRRNLKCPITLSTFQAPVRSRVCVHVYSKEAVLEMLRRSLAGKIKCPVAGCDKSITERDLERDRVMERRVREEAEGSDDEGRDGEALSSDNDGGNSDVLDIL